MPQYKAGHWTSVAHRSRGKSLKWVKRKAIAEFVRRKFLPKASPGDLEEQISPLIPARYAIEDNEISFIREKTGDVRKDGLRRGKKEGVAGCLGDCRRCGTATTIFRGLSAGKKRWRGKAGRESVLPVTPLQSSFVQQGQRIPQKNVLQKVTREKTFPVDERKGLNDRRARKLIEEEKPHPRTKTNQRITDDNKKKKREASKKSKLAISRAKPRRRTTICTGKGGPLSLNNNRLVVTGFGVREPRASSEKGAEIGRVQ